MADEPTRAQKVERYYRKQVYEKLTELMKILEPMGDYPQAYTYGELLELAGKRINDERQAVWTAPTTEETDAPNAEAATNL